MNDSKQDNPQSIEEMEKEIEEMEKEIEDLILLEDEIEKTKKGIAYEELEHVHAYLTGRMDMFLNLHHSGKGLHEGLRLYRTELVRGLVNIRKVLVDGALDLESLRAFSKVAFHLLRGFDDLALMATKPLHGKSKRSEQAQKLNAAKKESWHGYLWSDAKDLYQQYRDSGKGAEASRISVGRNMQNETRRKKPPSKTTMITKGLAG